MYVYEALIICTSTLIIAVGAIVMNYNTQVSFFLRNIKMAIISKRGQTDV